MANFSHKRSIRRLVQAFKDGLAGEKLAGLWDGETERVVESFYEGLLLCVEDELYLQEFLQFGSMYRAAGELGVRRRYREVPIEMVMREHILLRDIFWEHRSSRSQKVHDFATEKRLLQCFNNLLQATLHAYQTSDVTADILDPLRDHVTGAYNSLYFMARLDEEVKRAERYLRDVTVVLFHLDSQFQPDSSGEAEFMRAVARVLRRNIRASDTLARVEGAKFAILAPETKADDAAATAQRIRGQILDYLAVLGEEFSGVGVEIGIAAYPTDGDQAEVLMQEANEKILGEKLGGL